MYFAVNKNNFAQVLESLNERALRAVFVDKRSSYQSLLDKINLTI